MAHKGALKSQVGGNHYDFPIQPIEFIQKNKLDFIQGCFIRYGSRHKMKNKDEDIKKILHYALISLQLDYGYTPAQINEVLRSFITEEE